MFQLVKYAVYSYPSYSQGHRVTIWKPELHIELRFTWGRIRTQYFISILEIIGIGYKMQDAGIGDLRLKIRILTRDNLYWWYKLIEQRWRIIIFG